jgi:hypothetical protein
MIEIMVMMVVTTLVSSLTFLCWATGNLLFGYAIIGIAVALSIFATISLLMKE